MRVCVKRSFFDLETKRRYNRGGSYEGMNARRIRELQAAGYLEPFHLPPASPAPPADGPEPAGAPEQVETTADPGAAAAVTPETVSAAEGKPGRSTPRPKAPAG